MLRNFLIVVCLLSATADLFAMVYDKPFPNSSSWFHSAWLAMIVLGSALTLTRLERLDDRLEALEDKQKAQTL